MSLSGTCNGSIDGSRNGTGDHSADTSLGAADGSCNGSNKAGCDGAADYSAANDSIPTSPMKTVATLQSIGGEIDGMKPLMNTWSG